MLKIINPADVIHQAKNLINETEDRSNRRSNIGLEGSLCDMKSRRGMANSQH